MLEDKIVKSVDERLTRMYRSMLEDEDARYAVRREKIEEKALRATILVTKIANGIITVEG